ncbi:uncharacterized protein UTRI_06255_B [Ustilago trichophora]|uniref:Stress-response A/B barrel domain-containing protein n=1 Tax=Ustilago trichophora TaxID=86804 RepID=A0A5C3EL31_9BASI|nr:uncharacterized protein UTRI_06255_B [Ustilago trichophora]
MRAIALSVWLILCIFANSALSALDQYQKPHRDPSGLLPPYIVTHVPANYGILELRERLTNALQRPVSLLHPFPLAAVTLFPPEFTSPPLTHSSLISHFRNLDPLHRTLFNLDPIHAGIVNYAFALPISSSHPELKQKNIAQDVGEKIFGLMSIKGPSIGSGEKGGIKELSIIGFAKAHNVEGFDELLEKAWGDPYAIELGSIVNAHELFSHVHVG